MQIQRFTVIHSDARRLSFLAPTIHDEIDDEDIIHGPDVNPSIRRKDAEVSWILELIDNLGTGETEERNL